MILPLNFFCLAPGPGPNNEIQNMKMKVGEGIIGKTFQRNKSYMYTNLKDILRDSSNMTNDNIHYLNQSYTFTNIQSIISVPICMEEQTVCVLIIYQNGTTPLLNKEDKELLESFSDQVSIALLNSALLKM
ncbi:GAF domain-containing protein [Priestia megaterium]